jgi:non-specific serine/threonine protein kinase
LDLLASLVDKSLLRQVEGATTGALGAWEPEPRYVMLETVREFGLEQLATSGEEIAVRRVHAAHFAALVERSEAALVAGEAGSFWRLGAERDNLRAALTWLLAHEAVTALRVASVLRDFWMLRGEFEEGRGWLGRALERAPGVAPEVRVAALFGFAHMAQFQGDYPVARGAAEEALALARAQGTKLGMLSAEYSLSQVHRSQGRPAEAVACAEAAVALARELGDPAWLGWCLERLGIEIHSEGDLAAAKALFEEALALFRGLGGHWGEAHTLHGLAAVARDLGETRRAAALYGECLAIRLALDERSGLVDVLVGLADVAEATGQPEPAARLLGAVEALREGLGYAIFGASVALAGRSRAALRERLGEERFAETWEQGTRLALAEAVAVAQAVAAGATATESTRVSPPG